MSTKKQSQTIDRLVDAELSDGELKTLLRECENSPELWRSVALAFVESQVISKELSGLRGDCQIQPAGNSRTWRLPTGLHEWAAVAVAALLVVGIGIEMWSTPDGADKGLNNRVVDFNPSLPRAVESSVEDDSFRILVSNPDGSLREVEVPLLRDVQEFRNQSGYPSDLVDQFRRQGHQVEYERRFVPVLLKDGRDAIVPIDNLRFRSKQYQ